ncbi:MAG: amidohydrolase, partial [Pseudomonadota bacterium]
MTTLHRGLAARILAPTALAATLAAFAAFGAAPARADDAQLRALTERELPSLLTLYKELHAAPELSRFEEKTAARLAAELRPLGYEVTTNIGRYFVPSWQGHGVAAVLRNGPGPTLLIRGDMDALPVEERTGLPYASKARMKNEAGIEMPVMHACGHDVHVTALVGVARNMVRMKDRWSGTLVLIGQPAEETIDGAIAMLRDGLYQRVPKPDAALALHVFGDLPAGRVGVTPGYAMAQSTQMDVIVRGVGGHGSRPEEAKDPVVLAANIVVQLQTIVSREVSPFDQAVVTVGTIQGGTKRNIIPEEVKLELNIRTYRESVRQHVIQSVARISRAAALGAGMPEDRLPIVTVIDTEYAPAVTNDAELTNRVATTFRRALGPDAVVELPPVMGSEDFGQLGLDGEIPVKMFRVGATNPERYARAKAAGEIPPSAHSPLF